MRSEGTEAGGATAAASDVHYELTVGGVDAELRVLSVGFHERLSRLYEGTIVAHVAEHLERSDLLGADVHLGIERGDERRSLRGIVHSARVRRAPGGSDHGFAVSLEIVPAIYLMAHTTDSRIYQDVTVPDLVDELVNELVGGRNRRVNKDGLVERYPTHEYLVQHRESHLEFLTRLCNEEGIFFYFDHDEDEHEVLVLADSNADRPVIRSSSEGRVQYASSSGAAGHDVATRVESHEQIGATDVVVSGFDWSNPDVRLRSERTERGSWSGPALEVHEHFDQVRHYDFDGRQYRDHTAVRQARLHTERLDLARQGWTVETTVVSAAAGHTFTLEGTSEHDDEYLIVSVTVHGQDGASGPSNYRNTLHVIPKAMPFRPPIAPRRLMSGPETATVVGDPGEEITTDPHGRVHVQFHWDRRGVSNSRSSAWIRVAQSWAGAGFGAFFLPRHDMEVLVTFLGGDPDRPIITGCIHNGRNGPPLELPEHKTKSTIKTHSSPGGGGYNELCFEDKAGAEEVHLRAQRNLRELVLHDHGTHVHNDQTLRVGGDQRTHVEGDLREVHADHEERYLVDENRTLTVGGMHEVTVHGAQVVEVDQEEQYTVHGARELTVEQGFTERFTGGHAHDVTSGGYASGVQGGFYRGISGGERRTIHDGGRTVSVTGDESVTATGVLSASAQTINLTSQTAVNVRSSNGIVQTTTARVQTTAPDMMHVATQFMEDHRMKVGMYTLALTIVGLKVDTVDMKIDLYSSKIDKTGLKLANITTALNQTMTVQVLRAGLTMLG